MTRRGRYAADAAPGYSAEPEPCSTVSAVPVSIPNAVEAVAKGLFLAEHPNAEWNGGRARAIWWTRAYAAIAAMREPTDAMLSAVCPDYAPELTTCGGKRGCSRQVAAASRWRKMIDRALAWPTPEDVASAIEARRAATENTGAVHESATAEGGDARP